MFEPRKAHLDSREDFERNLSILAELIIDGKMRFGPNVGVESLKRVRMLPNSRIDLHTINESVRSMSNMASSMERMQKMQKSDETE